MTGLVISFGGYISQSRVFCDPLPAEVRPVVFGVFFLLVIAPPWFVPLPRGWR